MCIYHQAAWLDICVGNTLLVQCISSPKLSRRLDSGIPRLRFGFLGGQACLEFPDNSHSVTTLPKEEQDMESVLRDRTRRNRLWTSSPAMYFHFMHALRAVLVVCREHLDGNHLAIPRYVHPKPPSPATDFLAESIHDNTQLPALTSILSTSGTPQTCFARKSSPNLGPRITREAGLCFQLLLLLLQCFTDP